MKLAFRWDKTQVTLGIGTALAVLGALTPFLAHAPMWVGAVSAGLAAGLNFLSHAMHTDGGAS